jgi:hypothetical protein
VFECDFEASTMRRPRSTRGCQATRKKNVYYPLYSVKYHQTEKKKLQTDIVDHNEIYILSHVPPFFVLRNSPNNFSAHSAVKSYTYSAKTLNNFHCKEMSPVAGC